MDICCGAGGLLSKDSPFLDIILEGVKLRLPSAEVAYPRVEPALGAALLVHDALHRSSSSMEEAPSSPFASTPPRLGRHATIPHSHGEAAALSAAPTGQAARRGHRPASTSTIPPLLILRRGHAMLDAICTYVLFDLD